MVLSLVGTKDQLADICTKPLDDKRFIELRHDLNIIDLSNSKACALNPYSLYNHCCSQVRPSRMLSSQGILLSLAVHGKMKKKLSLQGPQSVNEQLQLHQGRPPPRDPQKYGQAIQEPILGGP
jgi:hypothetical protein